MSKSRILSLVFLIVACLVSTPTPATAAAGLAYVERFIDDLQNGVHAVATAPDGSHVYVGSAGTVTAFARDVLSGRLVVVEIKDQIVNGTPGARVRSLAISPNGAQVYATFSDADALAVFARDASTGKLTFVQEVVDGIGGVDGLASSSGLALSPDGNHLYASGIEDDAVAVFSRDSVTGLLAFVEVQREGVSGVSGLDGAEGVIVSPDGEHLYVTGKEGDSIAAFSRDSGTGSLTFVEAHFDGVAGVDGLDRAFGVAVTGDGAHVYVAGLDDEAVAVFARSSASGELSFVEAERPGTGFLRDPFRIAVSADGTTVFVNDVSGSTGGGGGVVVFARDATSGSLTLTEVEANEFGGVLSMVTTRDLSLSPDQRHLYVAAAFHHALILFQRVDTLCPSAPQPGCRLPTEPGKGSLLVKDGTPNTADRLKWKWTKGAATTAGEFGPTPETTTEYALCLYDASVDPQPRLQAVVPPGNLCKGAPCWRTTAKGDFKYVDKERTPDGVKTLQLEPGAAGEAQIKTTLVGGSPGGPADTLVAPPPPFTPPVTMQMLNSEGECWSDTFSTPQLNIPGRFKARGD
jgi:6-phosphogluconolactonase (cycloisomerase 2 family)